MARSSTVSGASIDIVTSALKHIREAIYLVDRDARICYVNEESCRALGYTAEELLQLRVPDVDPDYPEDRWAAHWVELRARGSARLESRHRTKTGRIFPVEITASFCVFDGTEYNLGLARDISERRRAEDALRVSEERLRMALEATQDAIWDWNLETNEAYYSPRWYTMLGYAPNQFPPTFDSWAALTDPADVERVKRIVEDARARGQGYEVDFRMRAADGSWRWIRGIGRVTAFDGQRAIRMSGTNTDVTERRAAEEELRLREAQLRAALDNTPNVAVQWYDEEGRVQYWNPASEALYGWRADEAIGRTLDQLILGPEDAGEFLRSLGRVRATGRPEGPFEVGVSRKDGRKGYVLSTVFAIPVRGRRTGFVCMDVDITDRKETENALRDSEARFRSLVEAAFEGIMVHENGTILEVNPQFAQLFGYEPQELIGLDAPSLLLTPASCEATRARIAAGRLELAEVEGLRKDGSTFVGEIQTCYSVFRGRRVRVVAMRDISERRRMIAELAQAQKMEAVGRLAGGVAHDFNNMLSVILGNAELALLALDPGSPAHPLVQQIQGAAQRSADLTRQLLAFARRQTVAPKVLDLNDAIERVLAMLRRLIGEHIDIAWKPGPQLWRVKIDPAQIDQVLANLLVNARDAIHDEGTVLIETTNVTLDEAYCAAHRGFVPGEYVTLAVSDDGRGIEAEVLAHLFEPFFTTKGLGRGTGLGLATVYGILKQNGGFVNVYSEPGLGTTFRIYLPRHAGDETVARPESGAPPRGGSETILLVEDEPSILRVASAMLRELGYTVLCAGTADSALRIAETYGEPIHVLLADVVMPGMNGRQLAERLTQVCPELRTLFMSGYTADVIAHRGMLDEGVQFLEKPFSLHVLAAKIRDVLA